MSTEEIKIVNEGIAVDLIHYIGDNFWMMLYKPTQGGEKWFTVYMYDVLTLAIKNEKMPASFGIKKINKSFVLYFYFYSIAFILIPIIINLENFLISYIFLFYFPFQMLFCFRLKIPFIQIDNFKFSLYNLHFNRMT